MILNDYSEGHQRNSDAGDPIYLGSLMALMCIYPWHYISPDQSPFVEVFQRLALSAAAIINFVVLTAAVSACNSAHTTGRMLFSFLTGVKLNWQNG